MKGFNVDIQAHMKDSLDKQDKTKAVDIFQVMADAIQKSKNNQISGLSQNSDMTTQYSAATLAAASKFKRVLGKGGLRCEAGTVHGQQLSLGHGAEEPPPPPPPGVSMSRHAQSVITSAVL